MLDRIREDIDSILQRDPAARSSLEVFLCSPGLHAVWAHRMHHWLWLRGFRLTARILSQVTRFWTGVEIHPGAVIGRRLFIDHGMGVVIGETAVVGNDVTLYQGVTLGGTGSTKAGVKSATAKRHPTLCDCVFIGNNANVLGDITIGANSRVGAGSVVLRDVPPNSTVVGVPAHIIYRNGQRVLITDPHEVKDPLSDALIALAERVDKLEIDKLEIYKPERLETLDRPIPAAGRSLPHSFAAEDEEREAYRQELEWMRDYVSMGEGI
jgi:serine O-acetyltransferase